MNHEVSPLVISGPSGVGKSTLAKHIAAKYRFGRVIPTTTRDPRSDEVDGRDYHFVTDEEYAKREVSGKMFMSNRFLNSFYGYDTESVDSLVKRGLIPVTEVYTPMISQFVSHYPKSVNIFLYPSQPELLVERMTKRGDSKTQIAERLLSGLSELSLYEQYFKKFYHSLYIVRSNNLPEIINNIAQMYNISY